MNGCPNIKSLDDSISVLSVQYGKKLLNGDASALFPRWKEELEILRSSKKAPPGTSAGYPAKTISSRSMTVPTVRTPGISATEKCHCFRQAVIQLLYMSSPTLRRFRQKPTFDHFEA